MSGVNKLGDRLAQERREKAARDERDILQKDVAAAVGTSATNVSRWESGQVVPGDDMIAKLAEYFGVSRSWLRYGENERVPSAPPPMYYGTEVPTDEAQAKPKSAKKTGRRKAG